ncbi:MAG: relaxase/mobilization nuclease domain-containing protein [bacterium]
MLIKFFRNGQGRGSGPVGYLIADQVLAYDDNRDLIRDEHGQPTRTTRSPLPQVLRGNPERTEALIDASPHDWTYRAGVISFAAEDAPTEAQQAEVMDGFELLAFAGLEPEQFDILWVRHTHEGRVELHFCTPRLELTSGRSLNIAPPGYQTPFDSLRDLMNQTHDWADPMEAHRALEVQAVLETPQRARNREEVQSWLLDEISVGTVTDRASMVALMTEVGFSIPRAGKDYLTLQDPDTGERWRMKGDIFHDDWQADAAPQREIERGLGSPAARERRLDGIPAAELQDRFDGHCSARAEYNRGRYNHVSELDLGHHAELSASDHALDGLVADHSYGDGHDLDRDVARSQLVLERDAVEVGDIAFGPSAHRSGGHDLHLGRPEEVEHSDLRDRESDFGFVHSDIGEMNADAPDSPGTRIAWLRRTLGESLRSLGEGFARLGSALDQPDGPEDGWLGRLRVAAHSIADSVHDSVAWLAERSLELRHAGQRAEHELGESESRRRTAEAALRAHDWGHEL